MRRRPQQQEPQIEGTTPTRTANGEERSSVRAAPQTAAREAPVVETPLVMPEAPRSGEGQVEMPLYGDSPNDDDHEVGGIDAFVPETVAHTI